MPWRHAAQRRDPALRCARAQRDGALTIDIERVWQTSRQVYGVDKVWQQLNREGIVVARCTVERLMRRLGLRGVVRGKVARTTVANATTPYPIAYKLYHFFLSTGQNPQSPQEILEFLGEVEGDVTQEIEAMAEEGLERSPKRFFKGIDRSWS